MAEEVKKGHKVEAPASIGVPLPPPPPRFEFTEAPATITYRGSETAILAIAADFDMSRAALAQALGLPSMTFYETIAFDHGTIWQIKQFLSIMGRVEPWAGDAKKAVAWYRNQPIPSLGNKTAEALVQDGQASLVMDYLDVYQAGGFA